MKEYYAVIFSSKRTSTDVDDYEKMSEKMLELARAQEGFIDVESTRGADGFGITISYWKSLDDIRRWKEHIEHLVAQNLGKTKWYVSFRTRVCKVERG